MLRTRLCELLEIEVPVLGAPMGPEIAGLDLAAAVSNAGGLGMISFGGYPPPALRERIRKLRTMTSKPFGVNVLLEGPHLPLPESAFVDACIAERVPVLSFFWGDPTPYVEKAHTAGVKVCDQVGSVRVAKRAAAAGVDFIIAQGVEKEKVLAATEEDTVRTTLFGNGWPNAYHRTLRTPFVEHWLPEERRGSEQRPDEPIIGEVTLGGRIPLPRFGAIPPAQDATGDIDAMDFLAGQCSGLVRRIEPAAVVVRDIVDEAVRILTERARQVRYS